MFDERSLNSRLNDKLNKPIEHAKPISEKEMKAKVKNLFKEPTATRGDLQKRLELAKKQFLDGYREEQERALWYGLGYSQMPGPDERLREAQRYAKRYEQEKLLRKQKERLEHMQRIVFPPPVPVTTSNFDLAWGRDKDLSISNAEGMFLNADQISLPRFQGRDRRLLLIP